MGVQPFAYCDWGFEYRQYRGCFSLVIVVSYQVAVCASVRSLVQKIPTEYGGSERNHGSSIMRSTLTLGFLRHGKENKYN